MKVVEKCKLEDNLNMKQQKIPFFFSKGYSVVIILDTKDRAAQHAATFKPENQQGPVV